MEVFFSTGWEKPNPKIESFYQTGKFFTRHME